MAEIVSDNSWNGSGGLRDKRDYHVQSKRQDTPSLP